MNNEEPRDQVAGALLAAKLNEAETDGLIQNAITAISRKIHLAVQGNGLSADVLYEIGRTAIVTLAGPEAIHSNENWKTPEKLDWALAQLTKALEV